MRPAVTYNRNDVHEKCNVALLKLTVTCYNNVIILIFHNLSPSLSSSFTVCPGVICAVLSPSSVKFETFRLMRRRKDMAPQRIPSLGAVRIEGDGEESREEMGRGTTEGGKRKEWGVKHKLAEGVLGVSRCEMRHATDLVSGKSRDGREEGGAPDPVRISANGKELSTSGGHHQHSRAQGEEIFHIPALHLIPRPCPFLSVSLHSLTAFRNCASPFFSAPHLVLFPPFLHQPFPSLSSVQSPSRSLFLHFFPSPLCLTHPALSQFRPPAFSPLALRFTSPPVLSLSLRKPNSSLHLPIHLDFLSCFPTPSAPVALSSFIFFTSYLHPCTILLTNAAEP